MEYAVIVGLDKPQLLHLFFEGIKPETCRLLQAIQSLEKKKALVFVLIVKVFRLLNKNMIGQMRVQERGDHIDLVRM